MATILSIFKSRSAKACFSLQKFEPAIERVYLPQCFGDKFPLALFVFHHMKDLKNKSSIRNTFFLFVWQLISKTFISSARPIMNEQIYSQNIGTNTPF